ncbi:MAG: serine hydrolase [Sphingomonadaceae bacterium]
MRLARLWLGRLGLALFAAMASVAALAQTPEMVARADDVVGVLRGTTWEPDVFAPSFIAQVPPGQVRALAEKLNAQYGKVGRVESISPRNASEAEIVIGYDRALTRFNLVLDPAPPHRVIGLWLTSATVRGDSVEKLRADMAALPGQAALLVTRLDTPAAPIITYNAERQMAVGSSFKLWLLAETVWQVSRRERRWSDTVPLGGPSLPSGLVQDWPKGAPITLHSLATLAISISDNTASDTLLASLGRTRVDAMVRRIGHSDAARTLPILSTVEAFALKMRANADLRAQWLVSDPTSRLDMLTTARDRLGLSKIDRTQLAGPPRSIDSIEWFASALDMATTLDWLRRANSAEARAIMAIAPGIPSGEAARFAYVGYKGGSEIGVFAMNFLVQTKAGAWYSVTGSWNNGDAAVNSARFEALMSRALAFIP